MIAVIRPPHGGVDVSWQINAERFRNASAIKLIKLIKTETPVMARVFRVLKG